MRAAPRGRAAPHALEHTRTHPTRPPRVRLMDPRRRRGLAPPASATERGKFAAREGRRRSGTPGRASADGAAHGAPNSTHTGRGGSPARGHPLRTCCQAPSASALGPCKHQPLWGDAACSPLHARRGLARLKGAPREVRLRGLRAPRRTGAGAPLGAARGDRILSPLARPTSARRYNEDERGCLQMSAICRPNSAGALCAPPRWWAPRWRRGRRPKQPQRPHRRPRRRTTRRTRRYRRSKVGEVLAPRWVNCALAALCVSHRVGGTVRHVLEWEGF